MQSRRVPGDVRQRAAAWRATAGVAHRRDPGASTPFPGTSPNTSLPRRPPTSLTSPTPGPHKSHPGGRPSAPLRASSPPRTCSADSYRARTPAAKLRRRPPPSSSPPPSAPCPRRPGRGMRGGGGGPAGVCGAEMAAWKMRPEVAGGGPAGWTPRRATAENWRGRKGGRVQTRRVGDVGR